MVPIEYELNEGNDEVYKMNDENVEKKIQQKKGQTETACP
jgi:hypothetical protein